MEFIHWMSNLTTNFLINSSISFISESLRYFPSDMDEKFWISSSLSLCAVVISTPRTSECIVVKRLNLEIISIKSFDKLFFIIIDINSTIKGSNID